MPPPPVWGAEVGYDGLCDALGCAYVNEADGDALADERGEAGALADAETDTEAVGDVLAGTGEEAEADAEALTPLCGPDVEMEGAGCPGVPEQPAIAVAIKTVPPASTLVRNGMVSIRALG